MGPETVQEQNELPADLYSNGFPIAVSEGRLNVSASFKIEVDSGDFSPVSFLRIIWGIKQENPLPCRQLPEAMECWVSVW